MPEIDALIRAALISGEAHLELTDAQRTTLLIRILTLYLQSRLFG